MTDQGVTFINVIEISAEHIDQFVEQWRERAALMRKARGFRDVRLHRALLPDMRFQLVNAAHWDSAEACEAAGTNAAVVASVETARKVAEANPGIHEVVAEHV